MSCGLKVIRSLPVTQHVLTAHNVPADEYPVWDATTDWALGARVIHADTVYEAVAESGNVDKQPGKELNFWASVGPTNVWRAFDLSSSTKTRFADACFFEFQPHRGISGLVLMNLHGVTQVRVRLTDPYYGVVYDSSETMSSVPSAADWYAWTFELRVARTEHIVSDIPSYPSATLRLDFDGAGDAGIGVIAFGPEREIGGGPDGGVHSGARLSIEDFSRKERNPQGDTYLQQRAFAKTASYTMTISNADLDNVYALLAELRATPCLWVASDRWRATTVWGFYRQFSIDIQYANYSQCSIDIEGLT